MCIIVKPAKQLALKTGVKVMLVYNTIPIQGKSVNAAVGTKAGGHGYSQYLSNHLECQIKKM